MLQSRSATNIFGGKATPRQLWDADADALGRAFPDEGRPYDESAADAALVQHLAFWTGKNCERMLRLMLRSGLKREKWDRDPKYLPNTIRKGAARQGPVKGDGLKAAVATPAAEGVSSICPVFW